MRLEVVGLPVVRSGAALLAVVAAVSALATPGIAAPSKRPLQPVVERSASGTVIQPTTTILHDGYGHTSVIVIPRKRSYLDTGTEVSVGDRSFQDYMLSPGGDPGRPNWFSDRMFRAVAAIRCRAPSAFQAIIPTHRFSQPA